ncbi:MAG: hypothetical protein JXM69_00955 [Anaerolineae bacterium]|nr:hypothetical protein [Anaerolineae bacterium]
MTTTEKLILAFLFVGVVVVFVAVAGLLFLLWQDSAPQLEPQPELAMAVPSPSPAPTLTLLLIPTPSLPSLVSPTEPLLPTPTSTLVVNQTSTPKPTSTPANCLNDVRNFEASGLITNQEVQDFLQTTIPLNHLNRCTRLSYISVTSEQQATPVSGRFVPLFRHIAVYAVSGGYQGSGEILDTLTHEIGHNVHYNLRIDNLELANQWAELHQQDAGFVSDYARTDEFEDFAESYRVYVRQPQILQLYSPLKYEFLRVNVFDGFEYPH